MIGKGEASAEEMRLAESKQLGKKKLIATEEIHLIISYPILESWERLDMVDSVRWHTIKAIKDVALKLWPNVTVEEM